MNDKATALQPWHFLPSLNSRAYKFLLALIAFIGFAGTSNSVLATDKNHSATDPYIVELYQYNCKACHGNAKSEAPTAFNSKRWSSLLKKKGIDGLTENTINGLGNMPAMGSCMECGPEEIAQLIQYMSAGS